MKLSRTAAHVVLGILLLTGFAGSSVAAGKTPTPKDTTSTGSTGAGVQGYAADRALQSGVIVQLTGKGTNKVTPAIAKNRQQMYGVTVDPHQLSVTISSSNLANEVFVATAGTYDVLVSTEGGAVKQGDYVTVSSLDGVAMDAGSQGITVFGRAVAGFDGKNNIIGKTTLKDTSGKTTQEVTIGLIPVAINIQHNPDEKSTKANLPKLLQRVGQAVAEKPVSALRIYLSLAVMGASIITSLVMLNTGIRSSVVSIGRNPLGKKAIFRGLLEIILTSFLILIIGLFAVYLLLKL